MSKTRLLIHIVFATKNRKTTLVKPNRETLFAYIIGIIRNLNCRIIAINGITDHIHMLLDIRPSIAISDLVKEIKVATTKWIKSQNVFENFSGWHQDILPGVWVLTGLKDVRDT